MTRCTTILLTFGVLLIVQVTNARGAGYSPDAKTKSRASAVGGMRTWTDSTGTRTVQAEYLGSTKKQVKLRLENGKKVTLRTDQLSDSDQQFVREAIELDRSPKSGVGKATALATSVVIGSPTAEENKVTAKSPFAVFGIQIGMTDREVARVLQSKGFRVGGRSGDIWVDREDSAMNKFVGARPQQFIERARVERANGGSPRSPDVCTYIEVRFQEDLPDRPGVGICTSVVYRRRFSGAEKNLRPLALKVVEDLTTRYGEPTIKSSGHISEHALFGDEKETCLKAYRNYLDLELCDVALDKRLRDAKEKVDKLDARVVPTNVGPLDY